jgi:hypothetical protein
MLRSATLSLIRRPRIIGALQRRLMSSTETEVDSRPFRVLGVQQIAIGNATRDPLWQLWTTMLGLQPVASHKIPTENVEEDIIRLGKPPHAVEIDLMCPIDPEKAPKVRTRDDI